MMKSVRPLVDLHLELLEKEEVPVQAANGSTNGQFSQATRHPANCSEPAALSEHLYDYERRNNLPRGTCGSARMATSDEPGRTDEEREEPHEPT
ncbi:hypothetical protein WMF45_41270 [Sorangium sp. So ce448]|uniref:hypothetical protein n=1 Tax=Sorangium sp. So ce448 TaxID=3133314 RepID=UPI003F5DC9AE